MLREKKKVYFNILPCRKTLICSPRLNEPSSLRIFRSCSLVELLFLCKDIRFPLSSDDKNVSSSRNSHAIVHCGRLLCAIY